MTDVYKRQVQDVVFVFAKLQDGALRSGFSCNFAAIHLLGHPAPVSYTHLDVYKRQVCVRISASWLEWAHTVRPCGTGD